MHVIYENVHKRVFCSVPAVGCAARALTAEYINMSLFSLRNKHPSNKLRHLSLGAGCVALKSRYAPVDVATIE